jgi:hypothetical protein
MAKPKQGMVTTLKCDRMWGRYTCNWFCAAFPQMRGKELTFRSDRAVELEPKMAVWLMTNRFI